MGNFDWVSWEFRWAWIERRDLSSVSSLMTLSVMYLVMITVGCYLMKGRKPFNVTPLTIPHNLVMCLFSIYCFVGMTRTFTFNYINHPSQNPFVVFCDPDNNLYQDMNYWYYLFYVSKFVEYLDTVFLILKGKQVMPPENSQYTLHVFHHAVTATMSWICLYYHIAIAWIGPILNTFVHIWMYGYYALAEMNKIDRRLGGKFITPIQIIQFVVCWVAMVVEVLVNLRVDCGADLNVIGFELLNYAVFFVFFVKIYQDKKTLRDTSPAQNSQKQDKKTD
uniref:Elongation of fatty acids protein n=1 Tax=Arcella intermedia TaxID=1963864 RepID=A0A6B2LD01_9EUKA